MGFALTHILGGLLRPASLLVIAAFAGLLLMRRCAGRILLTIGVVGQFAILVVPFEQWTVLPLEDRFPRPPPPPRVDGVIVLGGAVDPFLSVERGIPTLNGAAERMTELVALARRYPDARLVFTGGIGAVLPGAEPEAAAARRLFTDLGVSPDRVTYEDRSRTTYENALYTREIVKPVPGSIWLLVTSANHMPRAMAVFRAADWPVMPWPVAYTTSHAFLPALTNSFANRLGQIETALHEWVGLAAYRLAGRTSELFPAP